MTKLKITLMMLSLSLISAPSLQADAAAQRHCLTPCYKFKLINKYQGKDGIENMCNSLCNVCLKKDKPNEDTNKLLCMAHTTQTNVCLQRSEELKENQRKSGDALGIAKQGEAFLECLKKQRQ